MENPYIKISIEYTIEKKKTYKELLTPIKTRFEKSKELSVTWIENFDNRGNPAIFIEYQSIKKFKDAYDKGVQFYNKILDDIDDGKDFFKGVLLKSHNNPIILDNMNAIQNYIIIKYQSNYKIIMRKFYEHTHRINGLIGSTSTFEEVFDGFLFFFQTLDDFLFAQIDNMNPKAILQWIEKKKIDIDDPIIKNLLMYFNKIKSS